MNRNETPHEDAYDDSDPAGIEPTLKMSKYAHAAFPGVGIQQADAREKALADGLRALATKYGFAFKEPLQVTSNGEFVLSLADNACYGEVFVLLLNKHNPRTGMLPTKFMDPANSWCMLNHFDAARMLNEAGV